MRLLNFRKKDLADLYRLTSNAEIMKYVVDGKIWSEEKTATFLKYCLEEQKMDDQKRTQFFYRIAEEERLIGVIGFYLQRNVYHLRVFLDPREQGKGYFSQSLEMLKKRLQKIKKVDKLYSEVHQANERMNQIMEAKYYFSHRFKIGKISVNLYIIYLRPYIYMVKSDYFSPEMVKKVFSLRQNWISSDEYPYMKKIDFLHLDGRSYYDKKYQDYPVLLKNIVNDGKNIIINKGRLMTALKNKSFIPETHFFTSKNWSPNSFREFFKNDRIWLAKPEGKGAFAGRDIQVFQKFEDFRKIKNLKKYHGWSFQEYLHRPLLLDGRKFHLRVLFLYRDDHQGFWFNKIPVYLAKKPFQLSNFEDEEIHVSHYSHDEPPRYFPESLEISNQQAVDILKQLQHIFKEVMAIFHAGCYRENKHCYEMFGTDLMITEDHQLKLLEINSKIGLKEFTDDPYAFNEHLFNSELEVACDTVFPPLAKVDQGGFMPV